MSNKITKSNADVLRSIADEIDLGSLLLTVFEYLDNNDHIAIKLCLAFPGMESDKQASPKSECPLCGATALRQVSQDETVCLKCNHNFKE